MSTPTPMPRTCGEISCDECNDRYAALAAECDQLRAEEERLRSDRDCEKRLRKDADEFRENAIARAERAEGNLAALEQCHDDNCRGLVRIAAELADERAIVSRIWTQLGSPTYEQLKGRSIYDLISELKAELAAERARLDWLESPAGMDWQWQAGITRATIDAKMQKDAK